MKKIIFLLKVFLKNCSKFLYSNFDLKNLNKVNLKIVILVLYGFFIYFLFIAISLVPFLFLIGKSTPFSIKMMIGGLLTITSVFVSSREFKLNKQKIWKDPSCLFLNSDMSIYNINTSIQLKREWLYQVVQNFAVLGLFIISIMLFIIKLCWILIHIKNHFQNFITKVEADNPEEAALLEKKNLSATTPVSNLTQKAKRL